MNILTAINKKYIPYFLAMIRSLAANNAGEHTVYVATKEVTNEDFEPYAAFLPASVTIVPIQFDDSLLKGAPTVKRWPVEIYYRIFAAGYLPESLDKVLYMDSDIIVKGDISELYDEELGNDLFVATTNVHAPFLKWFIRMKNGAKRDRTYINTGVLLMNLKALRAEQDREEVIRYIKRRKLFLSLPDQDVISTLYGHRIRLADGMIFNLNERKIRKHNRHHRQKIGIEWVDENAKVIHYLGPNKPWKENYRGIMKEYYDRYKIA